MDQLALFPGPLADVRLSDTPLAAPSPSAARYEAIARLGSIQVLNGSEVKAAERWDAELNYLRAVTDELAAAGGDAAARSRVLAAHPRFGELEAKYGPLAPAAAPPAVGSALARSTAEMTLVCGGRELRKKLPGGRSYIAGGVESG